MFRNYVKLAFRNLWKNKSFSAINIFGLAIGLATCLLIALFVKDELSFDRYNAFADRIYRVNADIRINGSTFKDRVVPPALGPTLVRDYPQIEKAVRIRGEGNVLIKKGNETLIEPNCFWADSTLFDVFTLPLIAGDPKTALTQPYSIVLSESMAKKYFNSSDVIGKTLMVNNTTNYKISGVIKDVPPQSHLHFNFIKAMSELSESRSQSWLSNNFGTYVLVRKGTTKKTIDRYLKQTARKYAEPQLQSVTHANFDDLAKNGGYFKYTSIPTTKIHLYSTLTNELEPSGSIQYIYICIIIAIFILLLACVNFMNLSTAHSAGRSKEVGIRKVLGSGRSSLISLFLMESIITSFMALILALIMAKLLLPYFNQLSGKEVTLGLFSTPWLWPSLLITSITVGLLAGSYPALFLSAFKPIKVLKGKLASGFKSSSLRNALVVFQFVTAIILIVGTLVIYSQLNYIRSKNLGYNREQVLVLKNIYSLSTHAATFKSEVLDIPGVKTATMAGTFPTSEIYNINAFSKDASLSADQMAMFGQWLVDADYFPTLRMKLVQGRNFSSKMPTDSSAIIINETAAKMLGYADPLNKILYQTDENNKPVGYRIIGVVRDFNTGSLRNKIAPLVFNLAENRGMMAIRIHTTNTAGIISQIEGKYHAVAGMTGQPFDYSFMDEDFNRLYHTEQRTGRIFVSFALLAIMIACLGLFGLVIYAAEQRTKEIGIRKVLGANIGNIVSMLSGDFLKLVVLAALIAAPIAWWGMNQWLQGFAYRTEINPWLFVIAGIAAIIITLVTVSFQAIKAATANPIKSLRAE